MKIKITLGLIVFGLSFFTAQVGINTETPSTTLQIKGKDVANKVEGILIPRFTGDEIYDMPISTAQGYTASSTSNEANLVYATSAASSANQDKTGRGEFLTTSGFFYWDHPTQKWRRFFVATSTAAGNDGVVKINGNMSPTTMSLGAISGTYGTEKKIAFSLPLVYASAPTTSWPENTPGYNDTSVNKDQYVYLDGKLRENNIEGQVHIWRLIITAEAGSGSSGSVKAALKNPDSGFIVNSIALLPAASNFNPGPVLTFYFYTIADQQSLALSPATRGYEIWLSADMTVTARLVSLTRVSLFKD